MMKKCITNTPLSFTRQETIKLSGLTGSQISYLDKLGLILPTKHGNPVKPSCLYSFEQVLILKIYAELRKAYTFRQLEPALTQGKFPFELTPSVKIVFTSDGIGKVDDGVGEPGVFQIFFDAVEKGRKTAIKIYVPHFQVSDLIKDLRQNAAENNILWFEEMILQ